MLPTTKLFGEDFENMIVNAVAAVGNYEEVYNRSLGSRSLINMINNRSSGVIYSLPFGNQEAPGFAPMNGGKLGEIKTRGFLNCGVSLNVVFASHNSSTQEWSGFDVDFCRALSAAILNGATNVNFIYLPPSERFRALKDGDVDVLARVTTVTFERDVREPSTESGFTYSQPIFYDALSIAAIPE
jgi:ABC-type amino acid transport substrate-binding protein